MGKITLKVNPEKELGRIAPEIYGQFSEHLGRCIYDGIYVGENSDIPNEKGMRKDVVKALKDAKIPVLRWPGGCFADEYHWRDGIGPKESRRKMVNTNWGGTVEDNSFGTHEFMELCEQIGCEPYISVNVGSGTVQEAAEWVEYMTADGDSTITNLRKENGHAAPWKVKYLGIGNENWGCGGSMEPEYYASEYRRYQQFCKNYSGNELFKVACGPNAEDYNWTDVLMSKINKWNANGISLHYYTLPTGDWGHKGSSTDFSDKEYYDTIMRTCKMEELIKRHLEIMDKHDPEHNISLMVDEWGCWYDVEPGTNPGFLYQQNTMRDAIVAAINLNIFNKHCDRIAMANIAQVVNVLQSMILTEGSKMITTPTYDVFTMYGAHQGATLIESSILNKEASKGVMQFTESASISMDDAGKKVINITIANTSLTEASEIEIALPDNICFEGEAIISLLTGDVHDHNTFENPDKVKIIKSTEKFTDSRAVINMPACSVCTVSCHVR